MSELVITTAGLAAATVASPTGPWIHIASFKLGNDYTTPALVTDTDLIGTAVYTGTAISYNYYDELTCQINLEVPATAGPFDYGELGLFMEDGTLFGRYSYGVMRSKLPSTLIGYANILRIKVLVRLEQGAGIFHIKDPEEQNVLEMSTFMSLQAPQEHPENPVVIVHEPTDYQESVLLYAHDATMWNPANYVRIGSPVVEASTFTTIQAEFFTRLSMTLTGNLGKYLVQVPGGFMRFIESISGDTVTLVQPLDTAPSIGDPILVYELNTSIASGLSSLPVVTTIADFTVDESTPVNVNGDTLFQFPTNAGGYEAGPSNCYMTFKITTTDYFDGSGPGEGGHIVFGTRYHVVTDLPRAEAALLSRGNPAVNIDASIIAPTSQLEEISAGTTPVDRRFLFPGTDIPYNVANDPNASVDPLPALEDGVTYKVELWSRYFREGVCTSRFRIYRENVNGFDWDLLRDTGDVVVNLDGVMNYGATDVFFAEVTSPAGSWEISYQDIQVIWTPNSDVVGPDLTNFLQRTGGTFQGHFISGPYTVLNMGEDYNRIKVNNELPNYGGGEGDTFDLRRWTAIINHFQGLGTSLLITGTSTDLSDNNGDGNSKAANITCINQHIDTLDGTNPYASVSYGIKHYQINPSYSAQSHATVSVFPAFGHPNLGFVVEVVDTSGNTGRHSFWREGLKLRDDVLSTSMLSPNVRALGNPSVRLRGIENTGGTNAAAFALNASSPPFNMDNLCTTGNIQTYLSGNITETSLEVMLRPLYCMVSNMMREMRELRLLARPESGDF